MTAAATSDSELADDAGERLRATGVDASSHLAEHALPHQAATDLTRGVGRDEASPAPFVDRIALGRPGEPEDLAPAVLSLAGDAARHVTGVVLPVDGGTTASTGQPHV